MFALYGIKEMLDQDKIGGDFHVHEERDLIALFSTEEAAKEYVRKSTLKNPQPRRGFQLAKVFRRNSLLRSYDYVEIEEHIPTNVPIDPEL